MSAIHNYVGSIHRARRLARIPPPGMLQPHRTEKWDEDRVLDVIRERHREGLPVAHNEAPRKLRDAAIAYWGTWKNAIEAAGLDYATIRRSSPSWTREQIIAALRRGARSGRRGTGPSGPVPVAVWLAARRHFGSARAAIEAAGLAVDQMLQVRELDDEELAAALRRLLRERPEMSTGEMRTATLGRRVLRRFGSFARGFKALGVRWTPTPDRRTHAGGKPAGIPRSERRRLQRVRERSARQESAQPAVVTVDATGHASTTPPRPPKPVRNPARRRRSRRT